MGTIKQLRPKAEVGGDRAVLVAALKAAEEARQAVDRQRAAIERQRASVRGAEKQVEAANEAVKTAQQDYAAALADAAAADAPAPKSPVRGARQAAVDAEDELAAAKDAQQTLKANLPGVIEAARAADVEVERAISEILAPHALALLVRARSVQKLFMPLKTALAQLFERLPVPMDEALAFQKSRRPLQEVQAEVRKFFEMIDADGDGSQNSCWRQARELLRADPFAALPLIAPPLPPDETVAHQNRAT